MVKALFKGNVFRKNILSNFSLQFYTIFLNIIFNPLFLYFSGPEAFGVISLNLMFMSLIRFFDSGLTPALSREISINRGSKNKRSYLLKLFQSFEFIFFTLGILLLTFFSLNINWFLNFWIKIENLDFNTVKQSLLIIGAISFSRWITTLYSGIINAFEDQHYLNKVVFFIKSFRYFGLLLILIYVPNPLIYFFIYYLITNISESIILRNKVSQLLNRGAGINNIFFSYKLIRPLISFTTSFALVSSTTLLLNSLPRLLFSRILTLEYFGYLSLIMVLSNAIFTMTLPIGRATLPRLTKLHSNKQLIEFTRLYRGSTQLISVLIFSVFSVLFYISYEVFYLWTQNNIVADWSKDFAIFFILGHSFSSLAANLNRLQVAKGDLFLARNLAIARLVIELPLLIIASNYGIDFFAKTWCFARGMILMFFSLIVHHRFMKNIIGRWLLCDIVLIFLGAFLTATLIDLIYPEMQPINSLNTLIMIFAKSLFVLVITAFFSSFIRLSAYRFFYRRD